MPKNKQLEPRNIFRSLGGGMSAIFAVTAAGGLAGMYATEANGKAFRPREWGVILPDGTLDADDDIEVVPLNNGFADVYVTKPNGTIISRRVGFYQGKWVAADEWVKLYDAPYAERHGLTPEMAGKPSLGSGDPELPLGEPEPKPEPKPEPEPEAKEKDPDEVRKEAMRKRGAILDSHATANRK